MNDNFPLLRQLGDLEKNPAGESPLPKGIKYDKKQIIVENEEIEVFIPARESAAFDQAIQAIQENGKYIHRHEFGVIMRKYRGVRNRE